MPRRTRIRLISQKKVRSDQPRQGSDDRGADYRTWGGEAA